MVLLYVPYTLLFIYTFCVPHLRLIENRAREVFTGLENLFEMQNIPHESIPSVKLNSAILILMKDDQYVWLLPGQRVEGRRPEMR